MSLASPRAFLALAAVVVGWAAFHLLTGQSATITPAVWPPSASTPTAVSAAVPRATPAALGSARPSAGSVPLLPDALRRLNGETRRTATGVYQLLQQLETAVGASIDALVQRLEPPGQPRR